MSLLDRLEQLKQRLSTRPQFKRPQFQRDQSRDPYVFQIGFDFGTSYSKCVIRDRDKAFVFSFDLQGKTEFLLSSSILYRDGFFSTNTANQLYPEHGLWYIKMALVELAHRNFSAPVLERFNKAAGAAPGSIKLQNFVLSAALFYLSRALGKIRSFILMRYPDYGKHERDDMFVTMAIPVSNMADRETETLFLRLLKKAWAMACTDSPMAESASWKEMAGLIAKHGAKARAGVLLDTAAAGVGCFAYVVLYLLKSFIMMAWVEGQAMQAVYTQLITKGVTSSINALCAVVFSVLLAQAMRPALRRAHLWEEPEVH